MARWRRFIDLIRSLVRRLFNGIKLLGGTEVIDIPKDEDDDKGNNCQCDDAQYDSQFHLYTTFSLRRRKQTPAWLTPRDRPRLVGVSGPSTYVGLAPGGDVVDMLTYVWSRCLVV